MPPPVMRRKLPPAVLSKLLGARGRKLPPGARGTPLSGARRGPPRPKTGWYNGLGSAWNGIVPYGSADASFDIWSMAPASSSQPHGPVSPSRIRLHAPPSVRSPRPHNANNHAKTQAEIRVRFENAPPGTKLGTRVTGGESSIFQTGLAFAN
jgi:hypothetical protein